MPCSALRQQPGAARLHRTTASEYGGAADQRGPAAEAEQRLQRGLQALELGCKRVARVRLWQAARFAGEGLACGGQRANLTAAAAQARAQRGAGWCVQQLVLGNFVF